MNSHRGTEARSGVGNTNHVPVKQWRKWGDGAHSVFNEVFFTMRNNASVMMPPGLRQLPDHLLQVIAWNAAWVAGDAVNRISPPPKRSPTPRKKPAKGQHMIEVVFEGNK